LKNSGPRFFNAAIEARPRNSPVFAVQEEKLVSDLAGSVDNPAVSVKTSDTAYTWLIVSRVTAAVLGGFVVTYWTGAAVAKTAMEWDLLSRANAGMFSGFIQLVVYVALIIWVCATASARKTWLVLAVLTVLLVGVAEFTPGPPPTP
jgi:hypothetical protein